MRCGVRRRRSSDLVSLWLWSRPAAVALIGPLPWEPPQAVGAALKRQKTKQTNKQTKKTKKNKKEENSRQCFSNLAVHMGILLKCRFSLSLGGGGLKFPCFSSSSQVMLLLSIIPHLWGRQVWSKAFCCQMGNEGPEERSHPAHSLPTPVHSEGVTDEANILTFRPQGRGKGRAWGRGWEATLVTVMYRQMCFEVDLFGKHLDLHTSLISSVKYGHSSRKEGMGGQVEVEGGEVVGLRPSLERVPWAEYGFVLDLTPLSSHLAAPGPVCSRFLTGSPCHGWTVSPSPPSPSPPSEPI